MIRLMLIAGFAMLAGVGFTTSGCERHDASAALAEEPKMESKITVKSDAFLANARIPTKYTADGENVSPPLAWEGAPAGTKEWALIVEDPDAPVGLWVHWVIYKIPADARSLAENIPRDERLKSPAGAMQGKNSWKQIGYRGPEPPPGKLHHYLFRVYALDAPLDVKPGLDRKEFLAAISPHLLAQGELVGTYQR